VAAEVVLVGTSMAGIPERAAERIALPDYEGSATTPEEYIRESILDPNAFIAPPPEGRIFATAAGTSLMPADYGDRLSEQQISDLVAYLMTLREEEGKQP